MLITRLFELSRASSLSPDSKVRAYNVLHATLDNLGALGLNNDVQDLFRKRGWVASMLQSDYPYVQETLNQLFALPAVSRALVRAAAATDSAGKAAEEHIAREAAAADGSEDDGADGSEGCCSEEDGCVAADAGEVGIDDRDDCDEAAEGDGEDESDGYDSSDTCSCRSLTWRARVIDARVVALSRWVIVATLMGITVGAAVLGGTWSNFEMLQEVLSRMHKGCTCNVV